MTKKLLITGLILTMIGAVAAIVGFSMGASTSLVWDHGVKIAQQFNATKTVKNPHSLKNIHLDTSGYDVTFKTGETASVEVSGLDIAKPKVTQNDGTINITSHTYDAPGMWLSRTYNDKIVITLPATTALDSISGTINNGSLVSHNTFSTQQFDLHLSNGAVTIDGLQILKNGQLSLDSDNVTLRNVTFNNTDVAPQNGALAVTDSTLTGGTYASQNGGQTFTNTTFNQTVTLHNENGKVSLISPSTQGYQLATQNGSISLFDQHGTTQLNQNETAQNKVVVTNNNGTIDIH